MMKATIVVSLFGLISVLAISCGDQTIGVFERNRRLWNESGVKDYRIKVAIQKSGHAAPSGKFVITVRNGLRKEIRTSDGRVTVPENPRFDGFATFDDIFAYIERMDNAGVKSGDRRDIEFDKVLGYPRRVNLDRAGVVDDELIYEVLEFELQSANSANAQ